VTTYIEKSFLFCKPIDGRTASLEVLSIIRHFLEENEKTGRTAMDSALTEPNEMLDFKALVRKKPLVLSGHIASLTDRHLQTEISVRSYRLYFKPLSELLIM
jgi:hypothetical protein